jgi:hypothetical protein
LFLADGILLLSRQRIFKWGQCSLFWMCSIKIRGFKLIMTSPE